MSVVCLLSSHANCDILYVYLYACSVYLCLLACCVLRTLLSEIKWMMMMMIRDHGVHARQMLAWNKPRSLQPKKTNMSQILPLVMAITTDIQTAESCLIIHPAAHRNHLHYTPLIFCTYYWHAILTKREVCLCCMLLVITGRVTVGWS